MLKSQTATLDQNWQVRHILASNNLGRKQPNQHAATPDCRSFLLDRWYTQRLFPDGLCHHDTTWATSVLHCPAMLQSLARPCYIDGFSDLLCLKKSGQNRFEHCLGDGARIRPSDGLRNNGSNNSTPRPRTKTLHDQVWAVWAPGILLLRFLKQGMIFDQSVARCKEYIEKGGSDGAVSAPASPPQPGTGSWPAQEAAGSAGQRHHAPQKQNVLPAFF